MSSVRTVVKKVDAVIFGVVKYACVVILAALVAVVFSIFFGRYVLSSSPIWGEPFSLLCLVWMAYLLSRRDMPEEKRLIRVYMDMKGSQLYIHFTNFTAGGKLRKSSGRFASSKGSGHGYGLIRIDTIVAENGGYLSRNSEEGAFTTEVLLPQE